MTISRAVSLNVHSAIEVIAAPLLLVAPFALDFGYVAGALSIAIGAALIGLALSVHSDGERGAVPVRAHAGLDYVIAWATIGLGIAIGLATGNVVAAIFMAGFGALHMALTASTRFSPIGA